MPDLKY